MKAVIIAGGLGTRLRPLTCNTPKPIVPLVNIPFVVHQIEQLVQHGADEVILNLHYLSDDIRKVLDDGKQWGIKIHYSIEETPLGTAGAVKNAEPYFDDGPMIILNGDVLTDTNISKVLKFHREKKARVTLTLVEVDDPTPFGLVVTGQDGRVIEFIEKPSWERVVTHNINAGIYVVDPAIFKKVPKGVPYSFERELYPSLLAAGEAIFGYLSTSYWIDIGNPEKYKEAHEAILRGEVAVRIDGTRINNKTWIGKNTYPDASVKFSGASVIGEKVKIGKGTDIKDYVVVGNNVQIGEHAVLSRTIVWEDTKIGNYVCLSDCIIGKHCVIEDEASISGGLVLADRSEVKKGTRLTA
ncbi:MAG: NDP-sugar synthase [Candidatus Margulisbacteria bacterium]|nr:NDP-sugar synthase [Candidatus Margulisiibacteriota bacterium]